MKDTPPPPSAHALDWRSSILTQFTPEIAGATRLTIVADPDQLLTEQAILGELMRRGFDLLPFEDHMAFRFAYESRYRQIWDCGETTNLVVVLRSTSGDFNSLPFDLLEQARSQERCLQFSVGELFPRLAPRVVLELERSCFDALFNAQAQDDSTKLGVDASRDFVLRHVFGISPEIISTPAGLLRVLLRRHYRGFSFPPELDRRITHVLRRSDRWDEWPLEEIVPSRTAFHTFLSERWPRFVERSVEGESGELGPNGAVASLRFSGPADLPFDHDDVRIYIDALFQEGQLEPTKGFHADQVPDTWMRVGIAGADGDDRAERSTRLLQRLEAEFPGLEADHRQWIDYARSWAEWTALRWELGDADAGISAGYEPLHDRIEAAFGEWMQRNYASLYNLSHHTRPAMVHHIPRYMARFFTATGALGTGSGPPARHALIVVDGLALDQWVVLRDVVRAQLGGTLDIQEDACFAWVPTLTRVSRQAIFAGEAPLFFGGSIGGRSKEGKQWATFWERGGAKQVEVGYLLEGNDRTDADFLDDVLKLADDPRKRMLGIVVNKIDQSMHGTTTGSGGLHALVRQWAHSGAMARLLEGLTDRGFRIALTSDHGNIHGYGIGRLDAGAVVEERSVRVHVFRSESTRAAAARNFPDAIEWPPVGLPKDYLALLAPGRGAFVAEGRHAVGHGGIAMEEVIVPFVKIRRVAQ